MASSENIVNEVHNISAKLVELLSTKDRIFHRLIIRMNIEKLLNNRSRFIMNVDFQPGLDWINIDKPFSLRRDGVIKVLDFFTYCCVNCLHVFPQLKALEKKFPIEKGVVVIGVHTPKFSNERTISNVRAAVSRYDITHPVVNDTEEHFWNIFGITCWPTLVVLGPSNELLLYLMGETHQDLLHLFVEETLCVCNERRWIYLENSFEIGSDLQPQKSLEQLNFPGKVVVIEDSSGFLVAVADTGNHRIVITDSEGKIKHVIGSGESGLKDGCFEDAQFHCPQGLVFSDPSTLYVADTENHAIRKVDLADGSVKTVVGDGLQGQDKAGGKTGKEQQISSPWDLAILNPNVLLIAMAGTHQIWAYFINDAVLWKKEYASGICAAVAGSGQEENRNNSYPMKAGFAQPSGLTVAADRQTVFVADSESSTVRAVSVVDGRVSGVVGGLLDPLNLFAFGDKDGKGQDVKLQHPLGVAWSQHKQALYVCDSYNHKLKLIDPSSRECSTVTDHVFNEPGGLCGIGNLLYVADTNNHCVKIVNLDSMDVETLSIKTKESEIKNESIVAPVKEEQVSINRGGGMIKLSVSISVSDGIKPLPESPAKWTLALPEGWQETKAEEESGGSLEKTWTLKVPTVESLDSVQLRPQCQMFYCHNNLCSRKTLSFLITVTYSDTAPTIVSCPVAFSFTL